MYVFRDTPIAGLKIVEAHIASDARGSFVKPFHRPSFAAQGISCDFAEFYFSTSCRDTIRGMHFQVPPLDHAKMVACIVGSALDVVVDLRSTSPTYGRTFSIRIDAQSGAAIYIPSGCAHGFLALEDATILSYLTTSPHSPEHDHGIRWDSIDFEWPVASPVVSPRDAGLPSLADFDSPFP